MSEKRFEDDGVEYNNNYNYALLDTHYEFDGKMIIEWNRHSSNAEYTDLERITEILNIKQMRLESLMKHREEVGKLFDRIDEQQATIRKLQDLCGESDSENAKLRIENEQLRQELNGKDCRKCGNYCRDKALDYCLVDEREPSYFSPLKWDYKAVAEKCKYYYR